MWGKEMADFKADIVDASQDLKTIEDFVNLPADSVVNPRLMPSVDVGTLAGARQAIFEAGGLPATPFTTKALMTASSLANDKYAMVTDGGVDNGLYIKTAGAWVKSKYDPFTQFMTKFRELIDAQNISEEYAAAFTDPLGFMAVGIKHDGTVYAPLLKADELSTTNALSYGDTKVTSEITAGYLSATVDSNGSIAMGIKTDGTVYIPRLQTDSSSISAIKSINANTGNDTILIVGDSFTASHFTMPDKAYISNLSAFSDYRFKNSGISGNDATDMNDRIIKDIAYFDGLKPHEVDAKYAIICTYENDYQYRVANFAYYLQNLSRLIESVMALGIEPILSSQFKTSASDLSAMMGVARKYGINFIDATANNVEIGNLNIGLFHQGHPAVRTNAVFWLPMLDAINALPAPSNSIKIFRKRAEFAVSSVASLLFSDVTGRYKRFKEVSVSHIALAESELPFYDTMDRTAVFNSQAVKDEYATIANGLVFADYGLVEITLNATSRTLEKVTIDIGVDSTAQVYIRDYFDTATNVVRRSSGGKPTDADYLAKWDNHRGAWKLQTSNKITLSKQQLKGLMLGDKMQILLYKSGGFTLNAVNVDYEGKGKVDKFVSRKAIKVGAQLLINNTFDNLENWTLTGSPTTIIPIDKSNAPRLPSNRALPVNKVLTVTNVNTVGRSITLPKVNASYRLTVWCRNFPKAFTDNSLGKYDATQVINTSAGKTYPADAPITSDTNDIKTLRLQYNFAPTLDATKAAVTTDFACLGWRGVEFDIYVADTPLASGELTFNLSCLDGEIQIAKIELKEII